MDKIRQWDLVLSADSAAAAIYIAFLRRLEILVFQVLLGDDETLLHQFLGVGSTILASTNGYASRQRPLLIRLLNQHDDAWFHHSAVPNGPQTWSEAINSAFYGAVDELRKRLGDDITRWSYGAIHQMTYAHTLGSVKPLNLLFNRGPFPVGGDIDTVNMGAVMPNKPEEVVTVPSFRQIVDLADLNNSLSVHAPGQSGQPGSRHYDDFIPLWLAVEHHPMLFARDAIEAQSKERLYLSPQ